MKDLNQYYLQQMGIQTWHLRDNFTSESTLAKLAATVSACTDCVLHQCRTQTVFARGNPHAKIMIIGEAPGFNEDKQGLPFVGKAGLLLNKMLQSIGLADNDVYIANVIKCRPPENRPPANEEIAQCEKYLIQQIALVAPDLILALGRFAGQFIVKKSLPLKQLRQQIHYYDKIPCIVSYHPAYLLRKSVDKKLAYSDLLKVKKLLS